MFEREDKKEKIESKNTKENKQMNKKGQGGIEYVILFSFTVVFFIIVIYVANEQLSIVGKQQRLEQAKLALKEIADAATDVYQQGAGARVVKSIVFPNGVSGDGEIVNNTLHVVFEGTDLVYPLSFPISGKISTTPGSQEVIFTSYGGSVSIGTADFSLSSYSIYLQSCSSSQPQSLNYTIQIFNNINNTILIDSSVDFNSSSVNLSIFPSYFNIPMGQSDNASVIANVSANTIGLFSGKLKFNSSNYSVLVPVNIEIISCGGPTSNVSYIILETYKDSGYSIPNTNFSEPPIVNISTIGWYPYDNITLDLKNGSLSMPGYPKNVQTDGSGQYSELWNATGPGSYNVYANDSTHIVNYSFTVNPC